VCVCVCVCLSLCVQFCPGLQHDLHITRGTKILFPANIVRIQCVCVIECVCVCVHALEYVYNSTIAFCQGGRLLM